MENKWLFGCDFDEAAGLGEANEGLGDDKESLGGDFSRDERFGDGMTAGFLICANVSFTMTLKSVSFVKALRWLSRRVQEGKLAKIMRSEKAME